MSTLQIQKPFVGTNKTSCERKASTTFGHSCQVLQSLQGIQQGKIAVRIRL